MVKHMIYPHLEIIQRHKRVSSEQAHMNKKKIFDEYPMACHGIFLIFLFAT
jgi:hypothetical protein